MAVSLSLGVSFSAPAQTFPMQLEGRIPKLWTEKADVVLELDALGPCGSIYYRILRSAGNGQEICALMLTAAAGGRKIRVEVSQCFGTHAIVSHGAAVFYSGGGGVLRGLSFATRRLKQ
jgi:hypothetical protein